MTMINTDMRKYDYFTYGAIDEYGQPMVSENPVGTINIAVYITSQSIQDNILYEDAAYIGLTTDKGINNTYVIKYGEDKLKVLYVNPKGRYKQVFMARM